MTPTFSLHLASCASSFWLGRRPKIWRTIVTQKCGSAQLAKHDEFAIFRRFKKLNCLNLLYLKLRSWSLKTVRRCPPCTAQRPIENSLPRTGNI